MIEKTLSYHDLALSIEEIYDALGYSNTTLPDEETQREVSAIVSVVKQQLQARFAFVTKPVHSIDAFSPGKIILSQLKGSEALCWFVATAGQWFEDYQQQLMRSGDMVKVYIANEIGSLLAEKAADQMELCLERQLSPKGLSHTNRFSPGYCGWAVKELKELFELFDDAKDGTKFNDAKDSTKFGDAKDRTHQIPNRPCGITLTDSCLMVPIKSVSGVIGIGHNVKKHDYKCNLCKLESCYKRKAK